MAGWQVVGTARQGAPWHRIIGRHDVVAVPETVVVVATMVLAAVAAIVKEVAVEVMGAVVSGAGVIGTIAGIVSLGAVALLEASATVGAILWMGGGGGTRIKE